MARLVGRLDITQADLTRHSAILGATKPIRRWGSWTAAVRAAGLVPNRYTDQDLLNNLHRLTVKLGRRPRGPDVAGEAQIERWPTLQTYEYRFGSWSRALSAYDAWTASAGS